MKMPLKFVVTHQIAGITFRVESDVRIPHILLHPFSLFRVDDHREADINYQIRELDLSSSLISPLDHREQERVLRIIGFPAYWLDKPIIRFPDVRKKIEACLDYPELAYINLRWGIAIIRNYAYNQLDFFYPPDRRSDFDDLIMMAPYRNMFATFLPNFSSVMLHSAGIIRNGVAVLFFAPDEGGKSSVIHLTSDLPTLSDDHVILRKQNGTVIAHGTPFAPITSGPQKAKLGAIFLLEKSSHFALSPISGSDALQFIWNEHMHQWFTMSKNMRVQAFELIADACKQAQIYRMQFPKGFVDWNAVDLAIREL